MDVSRDIFLGSKSIGTALVRKQGLYYHICCKCRLSGEVIYKIVVQSDDRQTSLGVCVPTGSGFGVETKLPIKRLGEGELTFRAVPRHAQSAENFVPIKPEEPFTYIDRLNRAYLAVRNGQVGIIIRE